MSDLVRYIAIYCVLMSVEISCEFVSAKFVTILND